MDTRIQSKQIVTEAYMELGLLEEGILSSVGSKVKKLAKDVVNAVKESDIRKYLKYYFSDEKKVNEKAIEELQAKLEDVKKNPVKYRGYRVGDWHRELARLKSVEPLMKMGMEEEIIDIFMITMVYAAGYASVAGTASMLMK